MAFIVDASVAGAWLLPDEDHPFATEMMNQLADEDAVAPELLQHEIRSILLSAEKRGRWLRPAAPSPFRRRKPCS